MAGASPAGWLRSCGPGDPSPALQRIRAPRTPAPTRPAPRPSRFDPRGRHRASAPNVTAREGHRSAEASSPAGQELNGRSPATACRSRWPRWPSPWLIAQWAAGRAGDGGPCPPACPPGRLCVCVSVCARTHERECPCSHTKQDFDGVSARNHSAGRGAGAGRATGRAAGRLWRSERRGGSGKERPYVSLGTLRRDVLNTCRRPAGRPYGERWVPRARADGPRTQPRGKDVRDAAPARRRPRCQ